MGEKPQNQNIVKKWADIVYEWAKSWACGLVCPFGALVQEQAFSLSFIPWLSEDVFEEDFNFNLFSSGC